MKNKPPVPKLIEILFDIMYIAIIIILGLYLILGTDGTVQTIWGIMAFVLIFGDAFHLVPRIMAACTGDKQRFKKALGTGKLITSVTMTVFYVILWHIGLLFLETSLPVYTAIVYILSAVRIGLCLFPQNGWTSENPSFRWGIYRNIPFVIQGIMVSLLYGVMLNKIPHLSFMWLAILLSFAFYLPVVLLAEKYPKVGMLMIPKTCVYIWIVCMGIFLT